MNLPFREGEGTLSTKKDAFVSYSVETQAGCSSWRWGCRNDHYNLKSHFSFLVSDNINDLG